MSVGELNLHSFGISGDVGINYDYSYFRKIVKPTSPFSKEYRNIPPDNDSYNFGSICEFTIPSNSGDLLKSVCLEIETSTLADVDHYYIDSFGNALIEYAELSIGNQIVNRITSDYLQLYSESFHATSKDSALENLINKSKSSLLDEPFKGINAIQLKKNKLSCLIDLPFYFHRHPELSIPLCAITLQEVIIRIKLRGYDSLVYKYSPLQTPNDVFAVRSYALPPAITQPPTITKCELCTEFIYLSISERCKIAGSKTDYTITELQENHFRTTDEFTNNLNCRLTFKNPVKELYFIVQRDPQEHQNIGVFTSPLNYDPIRFVDFEQATSTFKLTLDQLKSLSLKLDGLTIIDNTVGNSQFLRASHFMRYHTNVPRLSKMYGYSFGLKPEEWYPTGQVNFSLIKNQTLDIELFESTTFVNGVWYNFNRNVRVYAKSYNILRVENGTAKVLF